MKVILIDDEKAMHLILKKMLAKLPDLEIAGSFTNTASAASFLEEQDAQLAFVDISMPGESGMQFAERMAERHPNLHIVFVTSHKEYAIDAFDLFALDYVVKPVSLERLWKSVNRAMAVHRFAEMAESGKKSGGTHIYALGGLEMRTAKGSVKWISGKSKELFGYLLLNRGRMISRARIISDVFGGMPQKNAETYLNTAIYQLRKSLDPHGMKAMIQSDSDGYGVEIADACIDFVEFEDSLKRCEGIDGTNLDQALAAEERYAGDLFGEKAYGWALSDIERYFAMYAGFVKKTAAALLKQEHQEYGTVVRILNKLLNRNELDEETVELLLHAYAAQKDKPSFVHVFRQYGITLREELGVGPPSELVKLYNQLLPNLEYI